MKDSKEESKSFFLCSINTRYQRQVIFTWGIELEDKCNRVSKDFRSLLGNFYSNSI